MRLKIITMSTIIKKEKSDGPAEKKQNPIENLREIATQLKEAASLNLEAVNLLENDYLERAFQTALNAFGFLCIVREVQQKIINSVE